MEEPVLVLFSIQYTDVSRALMANSKMTWFLYKLNQMTYFRANGGHIKPLSEFGGIEKTWEGFVFLMVSSWWITAWR